MRWFAYVDNGKWFLNSLLSTSEILNHLHRLPTNFEAFASIQNYDAQANILSCPLYIDVDSSSLYDAWETTKDTWCKLKSDFGIDPHVYFSGSKGFHIIMPFIIEHPKCHLIAKEIAEDYCIDLDKSVYTSRRMWRCNGTINKKTGNFKIKVPNIKWSLDDVLDFSKKGKDERFEKYKFKYYTSELFNDLVRESSSLIRNPKKMSNVKPREFKNLDPCIINLWNKEDWEPGNRHNVLYLLARSTLRSGDTQDEALSRFASHEYWGKEYSWTEVKSVVYSVFNNNKKTWTCRFGVDAEIMQPFCVGSSCSWHKDFAFHLNDSSRHETISG